MYKKKRSNGFCLVTACTEPDAREIVNKHFTGDVDIIKSDFSHLLKGRVEHEVIYNYSQEE